MAPKKFEKVAEENEAARSALFLMLAAAASGVPAVMEFPAIAGASRADWWCLPEVRWLSSYSSACSLQTRAGCGRLRLLGLGVSRCRDALSDAGALAADAGHDDGSELGCSAEDVPWPTLVADAVVQALLDRPDP